MSVSTSLYWMKPVFELPKQLHLPECMYQMKNPVASVTKRSDNMSDQKEVLIGIMDKTPLPELASLEQRWDTVLQELSDLKLQMASIKKTVTKICKEAGCPILNSAALENFRSIQGVVINADPVRPPYSLLLLRHLYKSVISLEFSTYIHSTVESLQENLKCFNEGASGTNGVLKIHLIWKNDLLDTELVTNPVKQLPIKGEVNILRFLARSGMSVLQYPTEDLLTTLNIDSILDLSHRLVHVKNSKEKASIIKNLNAKLGKLSYFGGEEPNIGDMATWSALKQINVNLSQDLTPSLNKWFSKINNILY